MKRLYDNVLTMSRQVLFVGKAVFVRRGGEADCCCIIDPALPSNRFEALGGDRVGQCSIGINQRWRVCFEWKDADAYNVEIVDYN